MTDPRDNHESPYGDAHGDPVDEPISYWPDDSDTGDVIDVDPVNVDPAELGCTWCIGGFAPAGTHQILGLVYTACIRCAEVCRCCDAIGLFPADTTCMQCLADALTAIGYTARFCHSCAGVLTVTPTSETIS